jgi:hypothetical protein
MINQTINKEGVVKPPMSGDGQMHERLPDYAVYKPNARGSGGVMRFSLNRGKAAVFVDAALQSGDRAFDWENKMTMKWALSDLGQVVAVLSGREDQTKLFHQSEKANSVFEMIRQDDPKRMPYLLTLSRQGIDDQSVKKVFLPLNHGEAAILEVALKRAIEGLLKW